MSNELNELLTKAKELLKDEMTNISYETWIKSLNIRDFTDDKIILIASSPFQKDAVETRYYDLVANTFKFITNKDCKIIVEYQDPDSAEEDSKLEDKSFNDNEIGVSNNSLNPKYTFDTGIPQTIDWYLNNKEWWENIISGEYKNYFQNMYVDKGRVEE